jgi:predicted 2-oxoglutarate/Fe(II)-dependent dioxygenase YbiX
MKPIESYISLYKGRFPNDLCDAILWEYADSSDWRPAKTVGHLDDFRICSRIPLSETLTIRGSQARKALDTRIFNTLNTLMPEWMSEQKTRTLNNDSGYDLLRYNVGGKYEFHSDEVDDQKRVASVISCLSSSEDYEGGEFEFLDGPSFKFDKGDILVFPSNFCFRHRVSPVTKGTRYVVITWFF